MLSPARSGFTLNTVRSFPNIPRPTTQTASVATTARIPTPLTGTSIRDNEYRWVKWTDPEFGELSDTVAGLGDDANIAALRKNLVNQQHLKDTSPALLEVYERVEGGLKKLKPSEPLRRYFVPDAIVAAAGGPGTSEETALEIKFLQHSKRPRLTAFSVSVVVEGAINSVGARGNVYKKLQQHHSVYSVSQGIDVKYDGDDLVVKSLFFNQADAFNFQSDLNDWEIHKELAKLSGIRIDPNLPLKVDRPSDETRVMMQDYKPNDSESPCGSINDLHSYHLSVPVTEVVEPDTSLVKYQCVDKQVRGLMPYKCHLKDKTKCKTLQKNENNMLAASWPFHQLMDGLSTGECIPMVANSVKSKTTHRSSAHAHRVAVTLLLEFRESTHALWFQGNDDDGARSIENTNK